MAASHTGDSGYFGKEGHGKYRGPSGKTFDLAQVKLFYSRDRSRNQFGRAGARPPTNAAFITRRTENPSKTHPLETRVDMVNCLG